MKKELRRQVLAARQNLTPEEVGEKSRQIIAALLDLPEIKAAETVMAYMDFRQEVETGPLLQELLRLGKRVVLPVTDVENKVLLLYQIQDLERDIEPGVWGIRQPKTILPRLVPTELDVVIVPGVAFDYRGYRLGYGGGFYDRFLPQTRPDCRWLAPIFELQLVPDVHPEAHDCRMHRLVTEERTLNFI
ncbi:MAG: 5-formyltetrahydrofolate cyclo-ligase [Bacillota bacterium]|uniref:5-formyltetrahydrofolate cyclo-ligase n=2 Tax=Carboxydocella TaxID=178898 RepID=A0A1T4MJZ4_9FIRM|nr:MULTISPECIES: 5-formyltetrahydrofolate cyclo-ligase [Carboxydocella]AVX21363.1 5-formyltetrahydrofolate cyclo-ligase [Carboxydocella thermautotrophica]AVX31861.1 5-formyltetrahydrofolate cyclo-ligase [Carboxydocella thermautotrophica]SJZ67410.1 5-formyltetrahydrofolate cyclo-ligase [Carboxydocella sporoproducens DSM 16521]GAW28537.1 5-formyltetrahydrofolate cyclo-ligase [Carboxydocella sp. ULO1]GAW32403.1 5-formyltetrahydrofolate cyclo-ligase [Carboxydocella sp. JDF658]